MTRFEEKFPHNMEPQLRQLGMPTTLVNGIVTLTKEFTICTQGQALSPEQAHLLVNKTLMSMERFKKKNNT